MIGRYEVDHILFNINGFDQCSYIWYIVTDYIVDLDSCFCIYSSFEIIITEIKYEEIYV